MLTSEHVNAFITDNGLNDTVICLHSAFKAFGPVEHGPSSIIDGFLSGGTTLVCPAFFYDSRTYPPNRDYLNNGVDYSQVAEMRYVNYQGRDDQVEACMGAIPRALVKHQESVRTVHAGGSFVLAGAQSQQLIEGQSHLNVYSVYKNIYHSDAGAYIVLAGVDLTACTPVHFAEELAGRKLFRRWSVYHGQTVEIEEGSCSNGFANLASAVKHLELSATLGNAHVSIYPFKPFIDTLAEVIRREPQITHCADADCIRCKDMVVGGVSNSGKSP